MPDFATRRTIMVDTQVRPSDVTKFPIIDAMLGIPRERFVPDALREMAYLGDNIDLGDGRVMLSPRSLSKMLDALDIQGDELVLDVGTALGYSAALMSRLAEAVVALEDDASRVREAQAALAEISADNVAVVEGPLPDGAPQHGPYDVIAVEGGVEELPQALEDQLKEGGRVACIFMEGALGTCRIGYRMDGHISWRFAFNAAAPVIPGFEKRPSFVF